MPSQPTEPEGLERGGVEIGEGPFGGLRHLRHGVQAIRCRWKSARDPSGDCDQIEAPAGSPPGGNRRGTLRGIATRRSRNPGGPSDGGNRRGTLRGIATGSGELVSAPAACRLSVLRWKSARDPSGDCDIRTATMTGFLWKSARDPSGDCDCVGGRLDRLGGNRRGTLRGIATSSASGLDATVEIGEGPFGGLRLPGDWGPPPWGGNRRGTLRGIASSLYPPLRGRATPRVAIREIPSGEPPALTSPRSRVSAAFGASPGSAPRGLGRSRPDPVIRPRSWPPPLQPRRHRATRWREGFRSPLRRGALSTRRSTEPVGESVLPTCQARSRRCQASAVPAARWPPAAAAPSPGCLGGHVAYAVIGAVRRRATLTSHSQDFELLEVASRSD